MAVKSFIFVQIKFAIFILITKLKGTQVSVRLDFDSNLLLMCLLLEHYNLLS